MAYILSEDETFDVDLTVPEGADTASAEVLAALFLKLANRTRWLRIRQVYDFVDGSYANNALVELLNLGVGDSAGFVLSGGDTLVEVPSGGWYMITLVGVEGISIASGHNLQIRINGAEPTPGIRALQPYAAAVGVVQLDPPGTHKISVSVDNGSGTTLSVGGRLIIEKVAD